MLSIILSALINIVITQPVYQANEVWIYIFFTPPVAGGSGNFSYIITCAIKQYIICNLGAQRKKPPGGGGGRIYPKVSTSGELW